MIGNPGSLAMETYRRARYEDMIDLRTRHQEMGRINLDICNAARLGVSRYKVPKFHYNQGSEVNPWAVKRALESLGYVVEEELVDGQLMINLDPGPQPSTELEIEIGKRIQIESAYEIQQEQMKQFKGLIREQLARFDNLPNIFYDVDDFRDICFKLYKLLEE